MKQSTVEITQKELDIMLGKAKKEGYDLGFKVCEAKLYSFKSPTAIKAVKLIDSLVDFLDERYELIKEDY